MIEIISNALQFHKKIILPYYQNLQHIKIVGFINQKVCTFCSHRIAFADYIFTYDFSFMNKLFD